MEGEKRKAENEKRHITAEDAANRRLNGRLPLLADGGENGLEAERSREGG